jgi:uncharacterized membrane protein
MESRAKSLGHPIHQMLIPFPFGLLSSAVIFDIIYLIWGNPTMVVVSYWMIVGGIIGGLVAAPFGLIDWIAIPSGTRANRVGMLHGIGNVIVLLMFAGSLYLRYTAGGVNPYVPTAAALALSFAGCGLAGVTGWLGGELVDRLSVGVDNGAHLDAPSSLKGPVPHKSSSHDEAGETRFRHAA